LCEADALPLLTLAYSFSPYKENDISQQNGYIIELMNSGESDNPNKIAIIGSGCSAAEGIKALRESGYRGEIHMLTDSRWPIYNPMLTTYFVADKIGFEQLFPYGQGEEFYRQHQLLLLNWQLKESTRRKSIS
jgi:hypothetical protein